MTTKDILSNVKSITWVFPEAKGRLKLLLKSNNASDIELGLRLLAEIVPREEILRRVERASGNFGFVKYDNIPVKGGDLQYTRMGNKCLVMGTNGIFIKDYMPRWREF